MLSMTYEKILREAGYTEIEYSMDDYHAFYYFAKLDDIEVEVKIVLSEDEEDEDGDRNELSVHFREIGKEDWTWQFNY